MILNIKRIVLVFIICGFFTVVFFDMKKDADEIKKYKYVSSFITLLMKVDLNLIQS